MYYYTFSAEELRELLNRQGWKVIAMSGFGVMRHVCSSFRGGMRIYRMSARLAWPVEVAISLHGGSVAARWGEYLYALCVRS